MSEIVDGREVIVVEFQGDDVPYSAFGKYYIRTADEDRELSPSKLRKIMVGQEYAENWENKSSNEMIDDVDDRTPRSFYQNALQCGRMPEYGYLHCLFSFLCTDAPRSGHDRSCRRGVRDDHSGRWDHSPDVPLPMPLPLRPRDPAPPRTASRPLRPAPSVRPCRCRRR